LFSVHTKYIIKYNNTKLQTALCASRNCWQDHGVCVTKCHYLNHYCHIQSQRTDTQNVKSTEDLSADGLSLKYADIVTSYCTEFVFHLLYSSTTWYKLLLPSPPTTLYNVVLCCVNSTLFCYWNSKLDLPWQQRLLVMCNLGVDLFKRNQFLLYFIYAAIRSCFGVEWRGSWANIVGESLCSERLSTVLPRFTSCLYVSRWQHWALRRLDVCNKVLPVSTPRTLVHWLSGKLLQHNCRVWMSLCCLFSKDW